MQPAKFHFIVRIYYIDNKITLFCELAASNTKITHHRGELLAAAGL